VLLKFVTSVAAVARRRRETRDAKQEEGGSGQMEQMTLEGHARELGAEKGHFAFSCTTHIKYLRQ
jgi:hypothetical protein